jgi:nuclear transport factor 2 (NTF2) superfamily protein
MDVLEVATRWAQVWERAWPAKDVEAIAALYSDGARYRAYAFRQPDLGVAGVRDYLRRNFDVEHDIQCRFGEPFAAGNRAAVQWWASWIEDGEALTMAGVTVLRFDDEGLIVDHRDYWNSIPQREGPYPGW